MLSISCVCKRWYLRRMPQRLAVAVFCLLGVTLNVWLACAVLLPGAWTGRNDFLSLYAGARLSGTSDLYSREAVRQVQFDAVGERFPSLRFSRLPYYGLLLKPLAPLPYRAAYVVWLAWGAAVLAGFAALWPGGRSRWIMTCWFLPAFEALFNGQDAAHLVLWIAIAALLVRRDRPFWAGVALALCASKFHLAVLLPVVILGQRRWRVAAGGAVAGLVMLALSFAAAGRRWPWDYYAVLTDPLIHPTVLHMPSLHGMQLGIVPEVFGTLVVAISVYLVARASSFEWALAAALAGGLLVAFHTYLADCVVLLPIALQALQIRALRPAAIALATPLPWLFLQLPPPLPNFTRTLILLLVIGSALLLLRDQLRVDQHPRVRI